MPTGRSSQTSTLLVDGRVLVAGGVASCAKGTPTDSAELYDPASGTFSPTGSLVMSRLAHSAILLSDGRVLILGGNSSCVAEKPVAKAELYDPKAGRFVSTGAMGVARDAQSAVRLADGRVLVLGGDGTSAELYSTATGSFAQTGAIIVAVDSAAVTLLDDGRVLIVGGGSDASGSATTSAELYEP